MNMINKDTSIYASFSKEAGNNGCLVFNTCFAYYDMNAIYKSFSIINIKEAINSAKTLGFKGFAVSMPFKKEVLDYVDEADIISSHVGSANTILNDNGFLTAYNTDYLAVKDYLAESNIANLFILGDGGFSSSVVHACVSLSINYHIINRKLWRTIPSLKNCTVFNCTPVDNIKVHNTVSFIDARPITNVGMHIAKSQARYQFELYTNRKFPLC